MKRILSLLTFIILCITVSAANAGKPWDNGKLEVTKDGRYLMYHNGQPFFWLANTAWLMPQRADRREVKYLLEASRKAGYNVVQILALDDVPSINTYGQMSNLNGWDFSDVDRKGVYGYWDHMDYIVQEAERQGMYIAMTCLWGSLVVDGKMDGKEAVNYATFLANRYKDYPNIIWIIGGNADASKKRNVWDTLGSTIKSIDKNHLMTFHPCSIRVSSEWFSSVPWIDFHMFHSGHRRYGQTMGDDWQYPIPLNTEEDNWQYVAKAWSKTNIKPVLDGEPAYEDIPQGMVDEIEFLFGVNDPTKWMDCDVRRYAYWSVFAGSCGHTYGHNAIMQFLKPGHSSTYGDAGDVKSWYQAIKDPGFSQMSILMNLMLKFPYFDRVPDQSVISGTNGEKYNRLIATRGKDYLMVYNYTGKSMTIDFRKIEGEKKKIFWMDARTGRLLFLGVATNKVHPVAVNLDTPGIHDGVLIVFDAKKYYLTATNNPIPVPE